MPIILKKPIMPEILITNFAKGASRTGGKKISRLANVEISKCRGLRGSEDIGEVRKIGGRFFGEKRV